MEKYVVQFNENHKWCGCFGFINEIKGDRIMVGVPVPTKRNSLYILQKRRYRQYRNNRFVARIKLEKEVI